MARKSATERDGAVPAPPLRGESDLEHVVVAVDEVERRLGQTPWWLYRRLDQEHRSRTLSVPDWFPAWYAIRPERVGAVAG
jgi:hypothetical protein